MEIYLHVVLFFSYFRKSGDVALINIKRKNWVINYKIYCFYDTWPF